MSEIVTNFEKLDQQQVEALILRTVQKQSAINSARKTAFGKSGGLMYGLLHGTQKADRQLKESLEWIQAARAGDHSTLQKAQEKYKADLTEQFNKEEISRTEFYTLAPANEGTNSAGGYNVPVPFAAEISRNLGLYGYARRYFRQIPMDRKSLGIAGLATKPSVAVTGENVAITASKPVLDQLTLTSKKVAAIYPATNEYLDDANVDVAGYMIEIFGEQFQIAEDKGAFQNSTTNWPGMLYYGSGTLSASGAIAQFGAIGISRSGLTTGGKTGYPQVGDTIGATDFWTDLIYVLQAQSSALFVGAKIFVDQNVLLAALSLRSSQGLFVANTISNLQIMAGLDGEMKLYYMGYEIVPIPSGIMFTYDASAHASAPFTAFCNPQRAWCCMGIRGGFTVDLSRDATADSVSAFENDLTLFRLKERIAFGIGRPETLAVLRTDAS